MIVFNKNVIVKIIVSVLLISMVYITFRIVSKPEIVELDEVKLKDEIKIDKSKTLAVMLQNNEGEYTESESNTFPTTGYRFNSEKSGCVDVNGNVVENALTYNNETKKVNLRINRKVKCYTYFDKLYTVTYDLDGGTFNAPFDETPQVKEVAYGDTYGDLPEPTKEGYTFKGWNGKNKLNKEDSRLDGIKNEMPIKSWGGIAFNTNWIDNNLSYNKTYSLSYDVECISISSFDTYHSNNLGFLFYSSKIGSSEYNSTMQSVFLSVGEKMHYTTVFNINVDYLVTNEYNILLYTNRYLKNNSEVLGNIKFSNIQLEEGTDATEYEPYYVTSDVKVTQQKDHTLKAIWEENE